jgi:hypothetical protein
MFILKKLHHKNPAACVELGTYHSLDEAIDAALGADLDFGVAVIEGGGHQGTVSDWIARRSQWGDANED